MPEFVFTQFIKENRPLSAELWRRVIPLMERIKVATGLADLAAFEPDAVGHTVNDLGIESPRLGRMRLASDREGETRWNADHTVGSPTRRFYVAAAIDGDISLTGCWPDLTGPALEPVDAEVVAQLGGLDSITRASDADVSKFLKAGQVWEIGADDMSSDGRVANWSLYTQIELTVEEEAAVAGGTLELSQVVRARHELIDPIVAAIHEQVEAFLARDLPDRLRELAESKRTQLLNRQAVRDSLSFPDEWRGSEPAVDDVPSSKRDDLRSSEPAPHAPPDVRARPPESEEVHLNARSRLSKASFEDVQLALRHWANAVERYPEAFGALMEDRISDLLAATWNATLPGANREVYTRGGRSDIFIQADVLDPGRGPATVFICETKWATGHNVIREALDPQLFGYLNVHDTAAVLLVLMKQKDFASARATYLETLVSVEGHRRTLDGPVDGWPLLEFVREGRTVTVCAAFVHLPKPRPGDGD